MSNFYFELTLFKREEEKEGLIGSGFGSLTVGIDVDVGVGVDEAQHFEQDHHFEQDVGGVDLFEKNKTLELKLHVLHTCHYFFGVTVKVRIGR
jgi:hypothetical protein